jgi:oxygen-independent coproporphyrinogen-3 oxidase
MAARLWSTVVIVRRATRLYVHVPFCRAKCAYCAFYSEVLRGPDRVALYLQALAAECARLAPAAGRLDSVFIGGGTPTLLGAVDLARLLGLIRQSFDVDVAAEFTVEANPDTLDAAVVEALAAGGVNRVSMGVQSFRTEVRQTLGRQGEALRAPAAVAALRAAGIRRLNADLMYHIPGQTVDQWTADLRQVLDLGITHLSAYALTLEEGTRLAAAAVPLPAEDVFEAMWQACDSVAATYGLKRYEVSNFACPGDECRHNLGIWYGDAYAGCGPAAASFDGVRRWTQPADLDRWLAGAPPDLDEIRPAARAAEILAFGLRTAAGWNLARFRQVTGMDPDQICPGVLDPLVALGLLQRSSDTIQPTPAGLLLNDAIAERIILLPEP